MSLYNALHGYEPTAGFVLAALMVPAQNVVRFRDAYVTHRDEAGTEPVMVVVVRTGSTSWTEPADRNLHLLKLPGFIDNADDEFDTSFALYRFEVPEHFKPMVIDYLNQHGRPLTIRQKTEQAIGPDQTRRQKQAGEQIATQLAAILGLAERSSDTE